MNFRLLVSIIACIAATAFALLNHAELWLCIIIFVLSPLIVYAAMTFFSSRSRGAGREGKTNDPDRKRKF